MGDKFIDRYVDGYYSALLNCDDDFFRNKESNYYKDGKLYYTSNDGSKKYVVSVYCKLENGRLYDLITNREYINASPLKRVEEVSYWGLHKEDVSVVKDSLSSMDKDAIKWYVSFIERLDRYSKERCMISNIERDRLELNKEFKRRENDIYRKYIDSYFDNYIKNKYVSGCFVRKEDREVKRRLDLDEDNCYFKAVINNNVNEDNIRLEDNDSLGIYCKNVNGRIYDVITNDEYVFARNEDSYKVEYVTYNTLYPCDAEEVFEQLSRLNDDKIEAYVGKICDFKFYAFRDNLIYTELVNASKVYYRMMEDDGKNKCIGFKKTK